MPRKYIRKTSGPRYSKGDLLRAVNDIVNHNCTYEEAEQRHRVPKSVIYHRIKGRKVPTEGRATVLGPTAEMHLENCIKAKARMGYPCDKNEIKNIVGQYVQAHNLNTPFKNGIPGDDWYYGFMSRHPSLSFKNPELLQKARKDSRNPEVVYQFYDELKQLVHESNLEDKPFLIFNADESGFCTDPTKLKAVGEKGKCKFL